MGKEKYIIGAVLVLAAAVAGTKFVLAKNSKNAFFFQRKMLFLQAYI